MSRGSVAFLSTGIPDRTQGGSGIFNDLVCRALLADGYRVHGVFRVSRWFMDTFVRRDHLDELAALGLEVDFVWQEDVPVSRWTGGTALLRAQHQFALCEEAVAARRGLLDAAEGIVALDLGWAWALSGIDRPRVAVLGDPHFRRLTTMRPLSVRDRGSWTTRARHLSVEAALRGTVRRRLAPYDGRRATLASFSPRHAREYRRAGIDVRHVPWFVPGPAEPLRDPVREPFRILHVGTLESSASRTMLAFWERELLPALAELPFPIELRLVGADDVPSALAALPDNVTVATPGFVPDAELEGEYERAAVFLSPMPYPIGVRTRIVSALAHALPVVAHPSAGEGLPELRTGEEIVYAASGSALAASLRSLHDDPARAERIGAAGRAAWERSYNPARNVPRLLALAGLAEAPGEAVELVAESESLERPPELG